MFGSPDSGWNLCLRVTEQLARPLGREWVRWGDDAITRGHDILWRRA